MSLFSKTGLVPIKKNYTIFKKRQQKDIENLRSSISKPVEFSIRPLGGLHNPYSKGCSVLCNHPAPSIMRNIIKKVKNSLSSEGGNNYDIQRDKFETIELNNSDQIPEELFRRYTDTDSRPLTPSPTIGSVRTKVSGISLLNTRRCVTPEPGKNIIDKRKTIILDLRRSHSQETLHWKGSTETTQPSIHDSPTNNYEKSPQDKNISLKIKKSEELKSKCNVNILAINDKAVENEISKSLTCINENDPEDLDFLQRRGRRHKKPKTSTVTSASFHLSQDPETQVSTLGPDSVNASTRPSLVPNPTILLSQNDVKKENHTTSLEGSFLSEAAYNVLKIELDVDTIENTFGRYLNKARQEAIKFLPFKENQLNNKALLMGLSLENDVKMPRKLSKSSSRFEMPLNLTTLQNITVFEYLSQYVWISRQRKQLYKRIFLKYIIQEQSLENIEISNLERLMSISSVPKALEEALGFYGNQDIIKNILELVFGEIDLNLTLNFRSWCGVVAFAERFALTDPLASDSCDELEKADFETMEERIDSMNVSKVLYDVLFVIRKGHRFI